MSRRDILGITGALATGAAASLLVAGCQGRDSTGHDHEAGDSTVKKHEPRPRAAQYVPRLGVIAIFPGPVQTFDDANKILAEEEELKKQQELKKQEELTQQKKGKQQNKGKQPEEAKDKKHFYRFYLPYYSEYLGNERVEAGTKLTCRILLIGNPPVAAMAVNVSREQFTDIHHDDAPPKTVEEVDNILTNLGYGRRYPHGDVLDDFIKNEDCLKSRPKQNPEKSGN